MENTTQHSETQPDPKTRPRRRKLTPTPAVPIDPISRKTPLERFRQRKALEQLRYALACQQPVIKMCVAERLSKHRSYAELARKYFLTVEEVADIMDKMRVWVRKYTTYFDNDWYWKDEGQPRSLVPDPR
ncbi:MAG: hypothetical protein ABIL25_08520 [candidate division WOR-3 bacterium]